MKLPFLALKVALGKISFLGVEKHVNAHYFDFGQNFLAPSCFKICGVRLCEKENGAPIKHCSKGRGAEDTSSLNDHLQTGNQLKFS